MNKPDNGITVLEIVDQADGSGIMNMDIEEKEITSFVQSGLDYVLTQMQVHDEIVQFEANTFAKRTRTVELTDEELNILFHFGVIGAIRRGMREQNKEEEID